MRVESSAEATSSQFDFTGPYASTRRAAKPQA